MHNRLGIASDSHVMACVYMYRVKHHCGTHICVRCQTQVCIAVSLIRIVRVTTCARMSRSLVPKGAVLRDDFGDVRGAHDIVRSAVGLYDTNDLVFKSELLEQL